MIGVSAEVRRVPGRGRVPWSSTTAVLRYRSARMLVATLLVDVESGENGRQRGYGRGPGVQVRRAAATLRWFFTAVGSARKASSEEYDFEKPPTSTTLSYVSPVVPNDALPRAP